MTDNQPDTTTDEVAALRASVESLTRGAETLRDQVDRLRSALTIIRDVHEGDVYVCHAQAKRIATDALEATQ